jgi:hypothetical protein
MGSDNLGSICAAKRIVLIERIIFGDHNCNDSRATRYTFPSVARAIPHTGENTSSLPLACSRSSIE